MARSKPDLSDDELVERCAMVAGAVSTFAATVRDRAALEELVRSLVPPYLVATASSDVLDRMVAAIAAQPEGSSLLQVMTRVSMPLLQGRAAGALADEVAAGRRPSRLALRCGDLTADEGWAVSVGGVPGAVILRLGRPGLAKVQAACVAIGPDVLDGGISSAILTPPLTATQFEREILRGLQAHSGRPDSVGVGAAVDLIRDACRRNIHVGLGPNDEGIGVLNVALIAAGSPEEALVTALSMLPGYTPPWQTSTDEFEFVDEPSLDDDAMRTIEKRVENLNDACRQAVALSESGPERRARLEWVAGMVIDYQHWYRDGEPWSGAMVADFLLAHLPRKVMFEPEDAPHVPADVARVLAYLESQDARLMYASASVLGALCERVTDEFVQAAGDPSRLGMAGTLLRAMLADGIDPTDEDAAQGWIAGFNDRPFEERLALLPDEVLPKPSASGDRRPSDANRRARRAAKASRRRNRGR